MHDIEMPTQKQHAQNGAPCSPIEQKCHFFPSTLLNKTESFDYENRNKLQRMTTQIVHNTIFFMLIFK